MLIRWINLLLIAHYSFSAIVIQNETQSLRAGNSNRIYISLDISSKGNLINKGDLMEFMVELSSSGRGCVPGSSGERYNASLHELCPPPPIHNFSSILVSNLSHVELLLPLSDPIDFSLKGQNLFCRVYIPKLQMWTKKSKISSLIEGVSLNLQPVTSFLTVANKTSVLVLKGNGLSSFKRQYSVSYQLSNPINSICSSYQPVFYVVNASIDTLIISSRTTCNGNILNLVDASLNGNTITFVIHLISTNIQHVIPDIKIIGNPPVVNSVEKQLEDKENRNIYFLGKGFSCCKDFTKVKFFTQKQEEIFLEGIITSATPSRLNMTLSNRDKYLPSGYFQLISSYPSNKYKANLEKTSSQSTSTNAGIEGAYIAGICVIIVAIAGCLIEILVIKRKEKQEENTPKSAKDEIDEFISCCTPPSENN